MNCGSLFNNYYAYLLLLSIPAAWTATKEMFHNTAQVRFASCFSSTDRYSSWDWALPSKRRIGTCLSLRDVTLPLPPVMIIRPALEGLPQPCSCFMAERKIPGFERIMHVLFCGCMNRLRRRTTRYSWPLRRPSSDSRSTYWRTDTQ